jgi:hypothetical protein
VLAAAVALVGLLPGQAVRGWLAVSVAVTAFADAVSTTVAADAAGWALIVVDVAVALQVVVAVSALLLEPRKTAVTESALANDYASYAQYVQAYHDYAQQYGSYWPDQYAAAGAADAGGNADGTAAGTATGDQEAWADMQAKYAKHVSPVETATFERSVRKPDGRDLADAGVPQVDRADRVYYGPQDGAGPAAVPHSPGGH